MRLKSGAAAERSAERRGTGPGPVDTTTTTVLLACPQRGSIYYGTIAAAADVDSSHIS